jgi:hypothetical protein
MDHVLVNLNTNDTAIIDCTRNCEEVFNKLNRQI